ncbi:hypothetical protein BDK51DRAFT_52158 [Blyttiomyces helicus]|uniref:Uncharacterized protein n=1 Tax=Blyttiomyces helicus TaxID=388810 RepID=A0A4P9WKC2_9FUNG|nr:hypothetical protein BDK51DRAFT_52158 [Blyttiomyces helicus]|eukprot:RKO91610.1 hypothetical protein BDK51DRAFT_52158 [Blyttiomyces helicus]
MLSVSPPIDSSLGLKAALELAANAASETPQFLVGIPFESALLWFVNRSVNHPLRSIYGKRPFFLATARPGSAQSNDAQKTSISLDLTQLLCIDVGPRDTEKHRFLNGAEPKMAHTLLLYLKRSQAASSDETCEYDLPLSRLLSVPLPIDGARYLLSVFSALHSDSPEGGVDVPTSLPALFVLQAEEASAGRKSYVGVEACSDKKGGPASRHVIKLNEHGRVWESRLSQPWLCLQDSIGRVPCSAYSGVVHG